MSKRTVLYISGWVLIVEGATMQLSTLVGLINREHQFLYFLIIGAAMALMGSVIVFFKPKKLIMYTKEGFASTAVAWLTLSFFGCLPLFISGTIPSFMDAFFESVSGFTTTGSTILTQIEGLPKCMLFWRSFTHWLGGMGVIVFLLAIIPRLGVNQGINLMRAESTGPSVSKSMPKLRKYAFYLYSIYFFLTLLEVILLLFGGMSLFDALTTSFSCAGTGGFMVYNDSLARFSPYIQAVSAVFMMLFGVNFYVYILILTGKIKNAFKNEELWLYFGIITVSTISIAIDIADKYNSFFESIHHSFFYVSSIISTTGGAIEDNNQWPIFAQCVIMLLTCLGACAGSTGGGLKISRVLILIKEIKKEIMLLIHPRTVQTIKVDGKKVDNNVTRTVAAYFAVYMAITIITSLLIALNGFDFETTFSSVLATLNNVGPGFSGVGSADNYAKFNIFSKIIFCFNMLAGRLELYPIILLFAPHAWKKN